MGFNSGFKGLNNPQIPNLMKICPVVAKLFHGPTDRQTQKDANSYFFFVVVAIFQVCLTNPLVTM